MPAEVLSTFLDRGILGAVTIVAMWVAWAAWREARADRTAYDSARAELTAQIIAAHKLRADDSRVIAGECAKALTENATALSAVTESQKELRETLSELTRDLSRARPR